MQDRGLAAYITELVGTLILVFAICTVVTLYVATAAEAQTGSDFAVVGLVHGVALFGLIITLGAVSGGHFNPAVTLAAAVTRRIDPVDAVVYMLAQLSGGVLGALLVKGLLARRGPRRRLRSRDDQPAPGRRLRGRRGGGAGNLLAGARRLRRGLQPQGEEGVGPARDRAHARRWTR